MSPGSEERRRPPGLPTERTALAWLRTYLAFLGGSLVLLRLMAHTRPELAVGAACVLLPTAGVAGGLAVRRYHLGNREVPPENQSLPDGRLPAVLTLLAILVAALGTLHVLFG
ncbi:DUF202 domain-containing protein [Actinopolyspora mortivallis]|uniref:DUF202 domain-containing protein n=1 Tax=Actinopolyspora mortivallis TaxID=33906 RepID=A0A2T0GS80_ACTMO|nr:DUF202 domain-containing protein [Actinopolyspora mortivallis]PRW61950.1 DUF202 domain-containing protein [Actinopolyspora mortivallis]